MEGSPRKAPKNEEVEDEGNSDLNSEDTEDINGEVCGAATEALSSHLVLRQVFLNLDAKTLLKFSLVNKVWCSTARFILRSERRCLARIRGRNPSEELLRLNSTLEGSEDPPYSGVSFKSEILLEEEMERYPAEVGAEDMDDVINRPWLPYASSEEVWEVYSALLKDMPYRHLEIDWLKQIQCPGLLVLLKIMKTRSRELTELRLVALEHSSDPSLKECLGIDDNHWLANLKILDLDGLDESLMGAVLNQKFELIEAAPQLQAVLGWNTLEDLDYFFQNDKVALMRAVKIYEYIFQDFEEEQVRGHPVVNLTSCSSNVRKLSYRGDCFHVVEANVQEVSREILKRLLTSLSSTLELLALDNLDLLLLPSVPEKPMKLVGTLQLRATADLSALVGPHDLERFNWGSWFPALEAVEIQVPGSGREETLSDAVKLRIQGRQDVFTCLTCVQILLDVTSESYDFSNLRYLVTLFPNVRQIFVSLRVGSRLEDALNFLWTSWSGLEVIHIIWFSFSFLPASPPNLDSVFCGISEEQAAAYGAETPESLMTKPFVPEAPSILSLPRLRRFQFSFPVGGNCKNWNLRENSRPTLLSHVTKELAFARIPGLEVQIQISPCSSSGLCDSCRPYLDHLNPFIKLFRE